MRKKDKLKNIIKSNILLEERYLNNNSLNELEMNTYAKQMNNTSDYGWTTFLSRDTDKYTNPKQKGNKEGRVNKLSRERFENGFYSTYPKGMRLNTNKGEVEFQFLKFETNYTKYYLYFRSIQDGSGFEVKHQGKGNDLYYNVEGIEFIDDSLNKVNDMLKYNEVR